MEIKELGKNIEKKIGKNGLYLLLGGAGLFALYTFMRDSGDGQSSELVNAVAYSSYPDAVTNANTIIGQVNDHTTTEIGNLGDKMNERFDQIDTGNEQIQDNADDASQPTGTVGGKVPTVDKLTPSIPATDLGTVGNKYNQTTTTTTTKYYKKVTKSTSSIVDALKSIGINSSFSNRAKIAKANGITNYKGTASQNKKLLSLAKSGKLKRS